MSTAAFNLPGMGRSIRLAKWVIEIVAISGLSPAMLPTRGSACGRFGAENFSVLYAVFLFINHGRIYRCLARDRRYIARSRSLGVVTKIGNASSRRLLV